MDDALRTALDVTLAAVRKARPNVAVRKIAINRPTPGAVNLTIVHDARTGQIDTNGCIEGSAEPAGALDMISVSGLCVATKDTIRCASGAVRALLGSGQTPSLALVMVLAHELGHVALGHAGTFSEDLRVVDLSRPRRVTATTLASLCFRDERQIELEVAADDFARDVLAHAVRAAPFYDPAASAAGSVGLHAPELVDRLDAVSIWASKRVDAPVEEIEDLSKTSVCDLLERSRGAVKLPVLGGTHPRGPRRVADLTTRLRHVVDSLSAADDAASDAFCKEAYRAEADESHCR